METEDEGGMGNDYEEGSGGLGNDYARLERTLSNSNLDCWETDECVWDPLNGGWRNPVRSDLMLA